MLWHAQIRSPLWAQHTGRWSHKTYLLVTLTLSIAIPLREIVVLSGFIHWLCPHALRWSATGNHYILTACPLCMSATKLRCTRWNWQILDIRRQRQWILVNIRISTLFWLFANTADSGEIAGFGHVVQQTGCFDIIVKVFITTLAALQVVDDIFVRSVSNVGTPLYMAPEAFSLQAGWNCLELQLRDGIFVQVSPAEMVWPVTSWGRISIKALDSMVTCDFYLDGNFQQVLDARAADLWSVGVLLW